ncbi:MAG: D-2-hydroxyacid dehydrogenase [Eubacteriales bacterium]
MKIVILDGYTLNPGDLSWAGLARLGELTVYDHTPPELTHERIGGAPVVFTNKTLLTEEVLRCNPQLRYIGIFATGYNVVDLPRAKAQGIVVTNVPQYGTYAVMQAVFSFILHFTNGVAAQSESVHRGDWSRSRDFCYYPPSLTELYGKTLGVIGFGRIGQQVAQTALAFGMRVLAYSRSRGTSPYAEMTDMDTLLKESDFVSLHCPLNAENAGMIHQGNLAKMKSTAILINTARGGLVVDCDLADALNRGIIAGAALDVLSTEPPAPDNPLLSAKNCLITPHTAWAAREARARLLDIAVRNAEAFLAGHPVNVVLG